MKRPNILFAIADDASHLGSNMLTFLNTPGVDYVKNMGVTFLNAFTTNPKCAPSRASILTGKHTWQLEEACNHFCVFPNKFKLYPDILEENGYFIGYTGKGWAPGDYKRGGLKRNPAGIAYNNRYLDVPKDTNLSNKDYFMNFCDFIDLKPLDKPFYFWYGGHEPHRQYIKGEGLRAGKKTSDVSVPSYLPDDEIVKEDLLDYAYEIEWFDKHLYRMIKKLEEINELENTLIVVTSDNGMPFPRVKGQMYECDFNLPLAMCYGNNIKCERETSELVSFIDFAPTFLDFAKIDIPNDFEGKSLKKLLLKGKDNEKETLRNYVVMGRERHDLGRENDFGYPVRCIRTNRYLYVRNFKPERWPAGNKETGFTNCDSSPTKDLILDMNERGEDKYYKLAFDKRPFEELYDILSDPDCIENLAAKDEYTKIKENLWNELKKTLIETNDPRIFGKGDFFDHVEYTGEAHHSWASYINGTFIKQSF